MTDLTPEFNQRLYNKIRESVQLEVAEEVWRATADGSYAGFFILVPEYDDDSNIVDFQIHIANDTAAAQLDMSVEDLEGARINEIVPANIDAGYFKLYKDAYLTGQPFEKRYTIPDGLPSSGTWVQMVTPIGDALIVRTRSVKPETGLHELEMALVKERTEMLEKVIREAGHDLRTPMSIIKTSLYLAMRIGDSDPEKRAFYEEQAREQVDRLNEILTELVDIAKMKEHGMNFRVVDTDEFIRRVYSDFKTIASEEGRKLVLGHIQECCILISEEKLYRAYTNIVRNAMTYSDPGDTITLSVDVNDANVWLNIEDTGIGMSEEVLDKIFDRFYRVNRERGKEEGNQGLGLSIAKDIVDAHGGYIDVKSQKGVGTTFMIVLPRVARPCE